MRLTIIIICFLFTGIAVQAQQALQKYYTAVQALESQADSEEKSKTRGKALAVFHDERVKEASNETAKNETSKLLRQYLDYDFFAAYYFTLRLTNIDDAKYFYPNYFNADEQTKYKLLSNRSTQAYNTRSEQPYPSGVPLYGNGVKGSWQNSGISAALKDPNSNLVSTPDNGNEDEKKGSVAYQAKNYTEAINWYKKAADKGNTEAMWYLGMMYSNGMGVVKNTEEAKIWLQKVVDNEKEAWKINRAKIQIGSLDKSIDANNQTIDDGTEDFQKGAALYQTKNYTEAFPLLKKASEKGQPKAMVVLATMYTVGLGVAENKTEAFNWYKKAAEKGEAGAMYMLGLMYLEGIGTAQNKTEAQNWLQKSADKGEEKAKIALQKLQAQSNGKAEFEYGSRLEQAGKINEAIDYYTMAANKGSADAAFNLGLINYKRRAEDKSSIFEKDNKYIAEAVKWFQKAADLGDTEALYDLGRIHYQHYNEMAKAKEYLQKAVDKGNKEAKELLKTLQSQTTTADNGEAEFQKAQTAYQAENYTEVINWLKKSAEKGNASAMFEIGAMYYDGAAVTKNETEALTWFKKAAEKGDNEAIHQVGVMYAYGKGMSVPLYEEALKWFKRSADKGNINSMVEMATIHVKAYNYEEAFSLYKKIADKGDVRGMYMLGVMYKNGNGVTKNVPEAKKWLQKAADLGNTKAIDLLKTFQNLTEFKGTNGKYGFKDQSGKEIISPKYSEVNPFSEGMAAVCIMEDDTKKWGYINENGKEITAFIYGDANPFSEGLAAVRPIGKTWNTYYGFIDKTGKLVIPHQYEFIFDTKMYDGWSFKNGKAKVYKDKRFFYIDKTGKEVK